MSLESIGPVAVDIRMPSFSEGAGSSQREVSSFGVSGLVVWSTARTLKELVQNPGARRSVAGRTGVLEYLVFTGAEQEGITGFYLLEAIALGAATYTHRKIGHVPFTLAAAYLGDLA